jgi:hypothetical protein
VNLCVFLTAGTEGELPYVNGCYKNGVTDNLLTSVDVIKCTTVVCYNVYFVYFRTFDKLRVNVTPCHLLGRSVSRLSVIAQAQLRFVIRPCETRGG